MNAEQYKKLVDELIELLDEGVYIVDKYGTGIHYNRAMARTEKVAVDDVLGFMMDHADAIENINFFFEDLDEKPAIGQVLSQLEDNATLTTSVFIYNQAFSGSYMYNRAAAASMIMFIIISAVSGIMFYFLRDKDEAKLHKVMKQQIKAERRRQKELAKGGQA